MIWPVRCRSKGLGKVLDQFNNPDNPLAHYEGTGPEIWRDTGVLSPTLSVQWGPPAPLWALSAYLKQQNPISKLLVYSLRRGASIPGIRRWPAAYMPSIFDAAKVDQTLDISQQAAEQTMRRLAREEGIFLRCLGGRLGICRLENQPAGGKCRYRCYYLRSG